MLTEYRVMVWKVKSDAMSRTKPKEMPKLKRQTPMMTARRVGVPEGWVVFVWVLLMVIGGLAYGVR